MSRTQGFKPSKFEQLQIRRMRDARYRRLKMDIELYKNTVEEFHNEEMCKDIEKGAEELG